MPIWNHKHISLALKVRLRLCQQCSTVRNCGFSLSHRRSWEQHITNFSDRYSASLGKTKSDITKSGRTQHHRNWNLSIKKTDGSGTTCVWTKVGCRNKSYIQCTGRRTLQSEGRKDRDELDWHHKTRFKGNWHVRQRRPALMCGPMCLRRGLNQASRTKDNSGSDSWQSWESRSRTCASVTRDDSANCKGRRCFAAENIQVGFVKWQLHVTAGFMTDVAC